MAGHTTTRVAVLWRGDREARSNAAPRNNRFYRVFEELPRLGINAEPLQALQSKMETEWTPRMMQVPGVESLPIVRDADFFYGSRDPEADDTYVLCEINVSSVFALPSGVPGDRPPRAGSVAERRMSGLRAGPNT